jgi:DNA primase
MRLHLREGMWFCFGCSDRKPDGNPKAADVIEWVRQTEGLPGWREAITVLDAGGPLRNRWVGMSPSDHGWSRLPVGQAELPNLARTPPERVARALKLAWSYYCTPANHDQGVSYLATRCIDVAVLEDYNGRMEVGYARRHAMEVVDGLRAVGFSDDEIVDAGLGCRRIGVDRVTDFYRQRVLIPLPDPDGRIAGFIGRNVGDPRWPKYKNSPRTHSYDKSVNPYQPLPAPADRDGQVVIVEGTIDAMAIAVAAIHSDLPLKFCPVTQSGRELSDQQVDSVLRLHPYPPSPRAKKEEKRS